MRVLFLDDEEVRHRRFSEANVAGCDLVQVRGCAEAVEALAGEKFDVVYLDHDLGACVAETGYDVALAVVALPESKRPRRAVIHSMNPVAARRMGLLLHEAGIKTAYIPFNRLLGS